jgi:hypothetical protein
LIGDEDGNLTKLAMSMELTDENNGQDEDGRGDDEDGRSSICGREVYAVHESGAGAVFRAAAEEANRGARRTWSWCIKHEVGKVLIATARADLCT